MPCLILKEGEREGGREGGRTCLSHGQNEGIESEEEKEGAVVREGLGEVSGEGGREGGRGGVSM